MLRQLILAGDLSKWGLANAVTATAKGEKVALTYGRATELESLGWDIATLTNTRWNRFNDENYARTIRKKDIEQTSLSLFG